MEDEESSGGAPGWVVSFADLMTLLFAAFVVLYGTIQEGKSERVMGATAAIREAFKEIPDIIAEDQKIGDIASGKFVFKAFKGETVASPGPKNLLVKASQKVVIDRDKNKVENLINRMAKNESSFDSRLRRSMSTELNAKGFTIKLVGAYFFAAQTYQLERSARSALIELGQLLRELRRELIVEGHADANTDKPAAYSELTSLRAGFVARVLIKDAGVPSSQIRTVALGASHPIAVDAGEQERNRRVEIKVLYRD